MYHVAESPKVRRSRGLKPFGLISVGNQGVDPFHPWTNQQAESAATGAALQAAINAGNPGEAAMLGLPGGLRISAQNADILPKAQANYLATVGPSTAAQQYAGALLSGQQANAVPIYANTAAAIGTQQAESQAAQTYKDVQGGGIAAQSYTALPYIIGGVVVLGLVGWILYYNKKRR